VIDSPLLTIHLFATVFMTGVIWFVQIVHYPLFRRGGEEGFAAYAREHQRRTSWIVLPAMMSELVTGLWLLVDPPDGTTRWVWAIGLAMIAMIWLSTFAVQVPAHRELARGFASDAGRRLVRSNVVRTAGWSGRSVLVLWAATGGG